MSLRFGILTISDRSARGERPDLSGPALVELVTAQGWTVIRTATLADDLAALRETLSAWADGADLDVILTTGGTGFAPRDVTPEATRLVIEREAPGLAEAMRFASLKVTPHAMLSPRRLEFEAKCLSLTCRGVRKGRLKTCRSSCLFCLMRLNFCAITRRPSSIIKKDDKVFRPLSWGLGQLCTSCYLLPSGCIIPPVCNSKKGRTYD